MLIAAALVFVGFCIGGHAAVVYHTSKTSK